jgi:glyoxylate/hydroxypyruvate reductase A
MAIGLFVHPDDPRDWVGELHAVLPKEEIRRWPDLGDRADIEIALVGKPEPGALQGLSRLRLIHCLWAGVDQLFQDPTFPRNLPLVRMIDPGLAASMAESALAHVLAAHRRLHDYRRQQDAGTWKALPQPRADERSVGILGLGELGRATASLLRPFGFRLAGWSRTAKQLDGIACFAGRDQLHPFLQRSEIAVNLLPLTPETRNLFDAGVFAALPAGGVFINLARGGHVVEADLLAALDAGHLGQAVLDVFQTEPLPQGNPLWRHPRVTVTPHVAAFTDARTAIPEVAHNIARFRAGESPRGLVDLEAGY